MSHNGALLHHGSHHMRKTTKPAEARAAMPAELIDEMRGDAEAGPPPDKLRAITDKMRELRAIDCEMQDLEERRIILSEQRRHITEKELVDLMDDAKVSNMTIQPEGNLPEFKVE